jgi:hypothetical protein
MIGVVKDYKDNIDEEINIADIIKFILLLLLSVGFIIMFKKTYR